MTGKLTNSVGGTAIECTNGGIVLGASETLAIGTSSMSQADLGLIDELTPGAVTANKAMVVDSAKSIGTCGYLGCTELNVGVDDTYSGDLNMSGTLRVTGTAWIGGIEYGKSLHLMGTSTTELEVKAYYSTITESGGANMYTLKLTGVYTGAGSYTDYEFEIEAGATTFKWKSNPDGGGFGAYTTGVSIPTQFTSLEDSIQYAFFDNTGSDTHTAGDKWEFRATVSPSADFTVDSVNSLVNIGGGLILSNDSDNAIIRVDVGTNDSLNLKAKGTGLIAMNYDQGTGGLSVYDGGGTNNINILPGTITDSTGAITFGDENLTTTGTLNTGPVYISGPDASANGPNITFTTAADAYPQLTTFIYQHDNMGWNFDCYYDGATWRSSFLTSNYWVYKSNDLFQLLYRSGFAPGAEITGGMSTGLTLNTSGVINIPGSLTVTGTISSGAITQSGTTLALTYHPLTTVGIAQNNLVKVSAADAATGEYAKFTATGLESRTAQELSDELEATIDHDNLLNFASNEHYLQSAIVETGALNAGSITSGFGNIDIGASTFATTGTVNGLIVKYAATGKITIGDTLTGSSGPGNHSILIGNRAGRRTTGLGNVCLGYLAGAGESGLSAETYCVSIGYQAGQSLRTGSNYTVSLGFLALGALQTGTGNIGIGRQAGGALVAADANIFLGHFAGEDVTSSGNIGIGYGALAEMGSGVGYNTAIGYDALRGINAATETAEYNFGLGYRAGYSIDTGGSNMFLGHNAGYSTTTGHGNLFLGYQAGYTNTTGQYNLFLGAHAGYKQLDDDYLLIIDSYGAARASAAVEATNSIIYGVMAGSPADQTLALNADVTVSNNLQIGSDTTYKTFYSDEGDIYSEDGRAYFGGGVNTVAERYGVGLQVRPRDLTRTFDYSTANGTFTAATATVYDAGQDFAGDGVIVGDFLVVTSANDTSYIGSTGEIISVGTTTLVVSMAAAGASVPDDLTSFCFIVYGHPVAAILDNGDVHFAIGVSPDASFKVQTADSNNDHAVHFVTTAGVDGNAALGIEYDPSTYADCSAIEVAYDATAFAAADTAGTILDVIIDNVDASAGDIHALDVALSDPANTDLEVEAVATHEGVGVIGQYLGDPASITKAYITDANGSMTETTISFSDAGPDEILDSGDGFVAAGFVAGQVITVTGDSDNNGTYTIASVADGTIVLEANDTLSDENAGDSVTITSTYRDVTTALGAAGTDVTLFDADNDVLLIAAAAKWDEINVVLDTPASHTIIPTYHFIEADGDWILFTPSDDPNGFSGNGTIRFDSDALATWGVRTINETIGAFGADDYYWQKITRTRNNLVRSPIEDTIKITTLGTKMEWDSVGRLAIKTYSQAGEPDATDLPANKFCFWIDTDDSSLHICYNQAGTIKTATLT